MTTQLKGPDRGYDYAQIETKLVGGLKEYAENAGVKGFVIGVSGGIDSAVVSTLCAKTGLKLIVLTMPIHQKVDEVNRAADHIDWLNSHYGNVKSINIDLTPVYETFKAQIKEGVSSMEECDEKQQCLACVSYDEKQNKKKDDKEKYPNVNVRARNRAETLYWVAGALGLLVAGTGNKVEDFGIGFFTKFGDGAVDISPIGEVVKSETRKLGQHMGVIDSIIQAKPTDGLHVDGATDEDQLKATYDEFEWAMAHVYNDDATAKFSSIDEAMRDENILARFKRENKSQEILDILNAGVQSTEEKRKNTAICYDWLGQGGEKFNRYINESVDESIKTKINTVLENDSELSHEEETEKLARAKEVLYDKFWKRHTANAHKMIMPPILPIH